MVIFQRLVCRLLVQKSLNFVVWIRQKTKPERKRFAFHNTAVLCYLFEVNEVFNVRLQQYNNVEAGEGKTALDTHFSHISHKIVRYVRLGNDLELQMGGMFWYKV